MSFIIIISNKGTEGIKAHSNSNNSENFTWFYEDVLKEVGRWDENNKTPVIIWDNASLHTLKESTEFTKVKEENELLLLPIPHSWMQQRK